MGPDSARARGGNPVGGEDLISGRRKSAVHGRFEMVAVDASGRPIPLTTTTDQIKEEIPS
jgi:hypothetical protein